MLQYVITCHWCKRNQTIYIGSLDSRIYAIDPDGSFRWSYKTGDRINSSPVIGADGTVYVSSDDGKVYAFSHLEDTVPPEIVCPDDITVNAPGSGTRVTYSSSVTDNIDQKPFVIYEPPLDFIFPTGITEVSITATDMSGNSSKCTFKIIVGQGGIGLADSARPCRGHDPGHTGQSPYTGAQNNTLKWSYKTRGDIFSSPVIGADNTIYIGSNDGNLYALDSKGSLKWRFNTDKGVYSTPAVGADNTVYVRSIDGYLYALNPDSIPKWDFYVGGWEGIKSSPIIDSNGTIYFARWENRIYAVNPDGTLKCSYQTDKFIRSSPAIGNDGTIYIGSDDNMIYALHPEDGSLKWSRETGDNVFSSPAIDNNDTVFAGSFDGKVYALNPGDGSIKWTYRTGDKIYTSPGIGSNGVLYVGDMNGKLYAFQKENGSLKWSCQTGEGIYSSPAISEDGTVYCNASKYLYAISPEGLLRWKYNTENPGYYSSPALGEDGTIYFGSGLDFNAINPDGSPKWRYTTEGAVWSSPAIGLDGTVYVGSSDGKFYAFGEDKYCHIDMDNDGYGDPNQDIRASACPSGYVDNNLDCNDQDGLINPEANELCDEKDNDCDGLIDEEGAFECIKYYLDKDRDGYGVCGDIRCLCAPEGNYSAILEGDSDDSDFNISVVDMDIKLDIPAGWSMISLPMVPYGAKVSELFPGAVVVYGYKNKVGYIRMPNEERMEFGKGYWILLDEDKSYHFLGRSIKEYAFSVQTDGWFMIGGCSYSAQPFSDNCTIDLIYRYSQEMGYQGIETLEPGKGYWIMLNDTEDRAIINYKYKVKRLF